MQVLRNTHVKGDNIDLPAEELYYTDISTPLGDGLVLNTKYIKFTPVLFIGAKIKIVSRYHIKGSAHLSWLSRPL